MPTPDAPATTSALSWSELMASKAWPLAVGVIGVSLWAQLFWVGLMAEGQFTQPRFSAMVCYLLPLMILGAGILARAPVILLALFTVGSLPGLVLLPDQEKLLLAEGFSMLRIGATLALYLAVASAGSAADVGTPVEVEPLPEDERLLHSDPGIIQRFVLARIGVLAILFALPAYAVFQDPVVALALSRHYGAAPEAARTFLGLIHFFIWSVAVYMMVLVPSLNLEYDYRRLGRRLSEQHSALTRPKIATRVGIWLAVSAAIIALMLGMTW